MTLFQILEALKTPKFQSIHLNATHDLGLLLDNRRFQLLIPENILQNASYLDRFEEFFNSSYSEPEFHQTNELLGRAENSGNSTTDPIRKTCPQCQCGVRNIKRIVGGKIATKYMYPWTVALRYGGRFYCGGSLVSDLYVVSAGHCTERLNARQMTAGFLQHDLRSPQRGIAFTRNIRSYQRHSRYNSRTLENDIAVLKLSRRVPIGSNLLRPICMPRTRSIFTGKKGVIAGWGTVGEFSAPSSKLRQAIVPIMSNKKCRRTGYGKEIKSSMLCAGYPKRGGIDACQGDSGGPLMVPQQKVFYLAGVISWGDGCAMRNHPGVYARVSKYIKWIRKRTRDSCFCG